ncbi:MAG: hypothetical protein KDC62_10875 [Aequorivita sp.]|nr:hypothetical protein [Aequorivita sp.]
MKKKAYCLGVLLVASIFISCDSDDENVNTKWELFRMIGSNGVSNVGESMEWREYYVFNDDATFLKHRFDGVSTAEVQGAYTTQTESDGSITHELTFTDQNLVGSCESNLVEYLILNNQLLKNTWEICDGPRMEYLRVE